MTQNNTPQHDITKAWQASQAQLAIAMRLRIIAALAWVIAISAEIVGIVLLLKGMFDNGHLLLLIGLLVAIAGGAIVGNILWKKANKHNPAQKSDTFRFFVQNQLGALITMVAFLPLIALILTDKDMDPKNKKMAGGVGVALAVVATFVGVSFNPPSTEQYTVDMHECAAQIKSGQPTTACSPEVAAQAQDIARDTETVAQATKSAAHPEGLDVVYWITPPKGEEKHDSPRVFHLCPEVSILKDKPISSGTVTEAYAQNAIRLTKQIPMEQRQCAFNSAE